MFFCLDAIIFFALQGLILGSYTNLEESYMRQYTERVIDVLDDQLAKLEITTRDWATWNDTYDYLAGRKGNYIADNLMNSAFVSININVIALVDTSSGLAFGKAVDTKSGQEIPLPKGFDSFLSGGLPLPARGNDYPSRMGIILLSDQCLLLAARPVLTSEGKGPPKGSMIMARFLDEDELKAFGKIVNLPLSMRKTIDGDLPPDFREALGSLSASAPIAVRTPTESLITGYALVPDIFGKPGVVFKVEAPRDIHAYGMRTIGYFILSTFILSLGIGITLWILLQKIVLKPLESLGSEAAQIRYSGDISDRIRVSGNDELADVIRTINTMLDALKQSQACLQKAQRNEALANLAGGTAHEFNNILAIMQGFIEMVADTLPKGHSDRKRLEQAYKAGERGKDIVTQILEFSQTSRQTQREISLNAAVKSALEMAHPLFPPRITVLSRLSLETRPILANPAQIEQIVINMCKNAIDAIGDKPGTIDIGAEDADYPAAPDHFSDLPPGAYVRLIIRDSGIGIPPSAGKQIFDPFFSTKKVGEGTGLGLSVVQGIMQQHNGRIDYQSEPGKGTSFEMIFPVSAALPGSADNLSSGQGAAIGPDQAVRERIMFVDAVPQELKLPVTALETLGYRATSESGALRALEQFRLEGGQIDIVFVNMNITDMNGLKLCHTFRTLKPGIRVILCMDEREAVGTREMEEAGIGELLYKPLTIRALIETIEKSGNRKNQ